MQSSEFFFLLERVGRERGLSSEILLESVKEALTSAYKKKYDESPRNLRVILDEEKGKVQVLVDSIGCSLIPLLSSSHLCRDNGHKLIL